MFRVPDRDPTAPGVFEGSMACLHLSSLIPLVVGETSSNGMTSPTSWANSRENIWKNLSQPSNSKPWQEPWVIMIESGSRNPEISYLMKSSVNTNWVGHFHPLHKSHQPDHYSPPFLQDALPGNLVNLVHGTYRELIFQPPVFEVDNVDGFSKSHSQPPFGCIKIIRK